MAPLPEARRGTSLQYFAHCGVDFAGPFIIKLTRKMTALSVPVYLCEHTNSSSGNSLLTRYSQLS